jgi:X-X-X-Leu-X-X-Gly heptad repeat protein
MMCYDVKMRVRHKRTAPSRYRRKRHGRRAIVLSEDTNDQLHNAAKEHQISIAHLLRLFIKDGLQRLDGGVMQILGGATQLVTTHAVTLQTPRTTMPASPLPRHHHRAPRITWTAERVNELRALWAMGSTNEDICRALRCSSASLYKQVKKLKMQPRPRRRARVAMVTLPEEARIADIVLAMDPAE